MNYTLLVASSPSANRNSHAAVQFARAILARGHSIGRIFFLDEGCYHAAQMRIPPQDEVNCLTQWVELAESHQLELVLCISSAIKRGLLDAREAERYDKAAATVHPAFILSGLGQLIDACANSDRVITFGGGG